MSPERVQHTAKLRATHEDFSSRTRRSFLAASAIGGTCLLVLLAAASYAQTIPSAEAQAHEVAKGGHFAAWEQPELFSEELRAAFRSLR
jgi:pimeloyl-ACP methyl ester carboxylesterase